MSMWRRLFKAVVPGARDVDEAPGRKQPVRGAAAPAEATQKQVCLADQLRTAVLNEVPVDWKVFRSHNFTRQQLASLTARGTSNLVLECLPFQILYPASWSIQLDPLDKGQRAWIRRIFVPAGSRLISEGKDAANSPAFQLIATSSSASTEEGILDTWDGPDEGKGFQDYTVQESTRITLNGARMIARVFDFTRPSGRWRSLMTVRAGNGVFYYFDVSGLIDDVESLRSQLVPVLANVRLYKSLVSFVDACERASGPSMPVGSDAAISRSTQKPIPGPRASAASGNAPPAAASGKLAPVCNRCGRHLQKYLGMDDVFEGTVCDTCGTILCDTCAPHPPSPQVCTCGGKLFLCTPSQAPKGVLTLQRPPVEIVAPTGVVIDSRSAEEKSMQQAATSPLKTSDEQFARRLVALVQQGAEEYRTKRIDALARTSAEIKLIGEQLYSNAGHEHMQRVYYRVTALGGNGRLLDLYWDGIGEWQG